MRSVPSEKKINKSLKNEGVRSKVLHEAVAAPAEPK